MKTANARPLPPLWPEPKLRPKTRLTMPQDTSPASRDIAVVESFFEAFHALDLERAFALMDDDVVYQNVPFPPDRGKAAVMRTLRAFGRVMTGFDVTIKNIAARDGVVLTERVDVLTGRFLHLDIWVCGTFELRNGRITLWRDYFDLASATTQLITGPVRKLFGLARVA
jgi:limonene-1,2-epoxide hydrolase